MGITALLQDFVGIISGGYVKTLPYAKVLLGVLITLDITFMGIKFAATGSAKTYEILKKVLCIGALMYGVDQFPYLVTSFVNSLVQGGFIAGGSQSSWELLHDPGEILNMAIEALSPIERVIHRLPLSSIPEILIYGILYLLILASFCIVSITIFFTMIQFYLFVGISGLLIPWIAVKQGRFIGEKLISGVLHFGVQLMVLAFILAITYPMLQKILETQTVDITRKTISSSLLISLLMFSLTLAILIVKGPSLMSSLLTGSPSFSGVGSMVGAVAGSVMMGSKLMGGTGGGVLKGGGSAVASTAKGVGQGVGSIVRSTGGAVGATLEGFGGGVGRAIHNPYKQRKPRGASQRSTSSGVAGGSVNMRNSTGASPRSNHANFGEAATQGTKISSPNGRTTSASESFAMDNSLSSNSIKDGVSPRDIIDVTPQSWGSYDTPLAERSPQQLLLPPGDNQKLLG